MQDEEHPAAIALVFEIRLTKALGSCSGILCDDAD
jgi:hypothetical protein